MKRLIISMVALLMAAEGALAQGLLERYNVTNLDVQTGLPHNHVNDIFADSRGFVWISCYGGGAVRYDGYTYMRLMPQNRGKEQGAGGKTEGVVSTACKGFAEDRYQRLWTVYDEGVVVTDMTTMGRTVPRMGKGDISRQLAKESVRVYCDTKGAMWHVARDSIFRYTFNDDGSVLHVSAAAYRGNTPDINIRDIDQNGTVWMSVADGLFRVCEIGGHLEYREIAPVLRQLRGLYVTDLLRRGNDIWISTNLGLYVYDPYNATLHSYRHTADPRSLSHDYATALALTSDGRLLVGTLRGLCMLDDQTGTFHCWDSSTPGSPMASDFVHRLLVYGHQLWIATETAGIIKLSPKPLMLRNYVNDPSDPRSLSPHPVNAMRVESDGTLWVGTVEGGLNRKGQGEFATPHSALQRRSKGQEIRGQEGFEHWTTHNSGLTHNSVSVLEGDGRGRLWIGTWGGGVNTIANNQYPIANNRETITNNREAITIRPLAMPDSMVAQTNYIGALAYDRRHDALWIGSNDGVFLYDLKTGRLEDPFDGNRAIRGCIGSLIDREGQLWMGCLSGVIVVDLTAGDGRRFRVRHLRHKLNHPESPVVDKITCFCETKDGTLWLGSNGYGLYKRGKGQGARSKSQETFEVLTTDDGLANNSVKGIVEDAQGRLWITTNNGLSVYSPDTHTFTNYGERDGLLGQQFYWNSAVKGPDGAIYVGSTAGLTEIRGENSEADYPVHLTFTQLLVDNQEVTSADAGVLDADISQARCISLHESNKSFAISFSTLTYEGDVQGHYSYRMKGFDDQWTTLTPGEHSARYTGLPPGTYTFEVAYTANGPDLRHTISIDIVVKPYFWKSWWFVIIVTLAVAALLLWQLRQRIEKLRRQEAEKLMVPIRKAMDEADDPEQLQARIQNILDTHEHLKKSYRRSVEADKQESLQVKTFMERATATMEQNYMNSTFGISEFAEAMGMSRSLLAKRLNVETGQSTGQFIRNYRLTVAKKLLLENMANRNITEIAYKVGFNDPKYFTRCFTHRYGKSPSTYVEEDASVD